jgi:hypothetical protein
MSIWLHIEYYIIIIINTLYNKYNISQSNLYKAIELLTEVEGQLLEAELRSSMQKRSAFLHVIHANVQEFLQVEDAYESRGFTLFCICIYTQQTTSMKE